MKSNHTTILWWVGAPILIAIWVWAPHLVWNVSAGIPDWWRIPVLGAPVFDTYAYLQWLGQIATGLDIGGLFRWFEWPLRALTSVLYPHWSIPEMWLLTRWLSAVAMLWVSGWCVRKIGGLDLWPARLTSLCIWLSLMFVLGMRPGVYSWYLPLGFFGLAASALVVSALDRGKIAAAVLWSVLALVATMVYLWFMLVVFIWIASAWSAWVIRKDRTAWIVLIALAALGSIATAFVMAPWLEQSAWWPVLVDVQERVGVAETRIPQITNPFLAMLGWIALLVAFGRRQVNDVARIVTVQWAWIALLLAWLVTPFIGFYIHNDHFRTPIVLLSWVSMAVLWNSIRSISVIPAEAGIPPEGFPPSPHRLRGNDMKIYVPIGVLLVALAFILKILVKPYGVGKDDLDILHLSLWFSVAVGAWLVIRHQRGSTTVPSSRWGAVILIASALMGGVPLIATYQRQFVQMPDLISREPVMTWIEANIPPERIGCADPSTADVLSVHTGRRIVPAETTFYMRESNDATLKRFAAFASGYDLAASGAGDALRQYIDLSQGIVCNQYPFQSKILRMLGASDDRINELIGCPRGMLDVRFSAIMSISRNGIVDENAFKDACLWVVVTDDQKAYWRIPSEYEETRVSDGASVWQAK
ncbi:MAG: hypothetical protein V1745_04635 [Patescibacteria group bacterium]